ncbi:recombination protein O N-terminal domain-containing protein [uncultured Erythrobacter sp.]|uniref:DNA repair protein RecO n=1 Tax=uncultured Erythrobacter sp. TaxID=263913 RepID=UPI002626CC49|nr:recombination protein O N-terminal domain-containing protein [uncultured Erythrobacter sp.]
MIVSAPAILVASRPHGETAAIARLLTEEYGLVAGYVAGGRGRQLRPVMIPGNAVALELRSKSDSQLPFARLELEESRGPWMTEPLPAAAINWACVLTASALPERNPYPSLYQALSALLDAVCHAPSASGWLAAMVAYETMLLREMGYGGQRPDMEGDFEAQFDTFRALHRPLGRYVLADSKSDVMAARIALGERLGRMLK